MSERYRELAGREKQLKAQIDRKHKQIEKILKEKNQLSIKLVAVQLEMQAEGVSGDCERVD